MMRNSIRDQEASEFVSTLELLLYVLEKNINHLAGQALCAYCLKE